MPSYKLNYKKLLMLLLFVLVALALGWLLYQALGLRDSGPILPPDTAVLTPDDVGDGLPLAGPGSDDGSFTTPDDGFLPFGPDGSPLSTTTDSFANDSLQRDSKTSGVTNHRVNQPVLGPDGSSVQYYNPLDGHFYRLGTDGQARLLSERTFHSVQHITWSEQQDQAVLYYPDGSKTIYNFNQDRQITLPDHWYDFSWSPQGDQLAFKSLGHDVENRWLAVVNSDGTASKQLEKIGVNADKVVTSWSPNNQVAGFLVEGYDFDRKTIYFIGFNGENFKALTTDGRGFEHQWSPQGDKLVFSTYSSANDYRPMLWRASAQGDDIGDNRYPLNLETWSHKCAFVNNSEMYCAVPQSLSSGAGLFAGLTDNTPDNLYHINIDSGEKSLVIISNYNMSNLMVMEDNANLYFTDSFTGRLHRLDL